MIVTIIRTIAFNAIARYLHPLPYIEELTLDQHKISEADVQDIEVEIQHDVELRWPAARNININSHMNLDNIVKTIEDCI